MVGQIELFAILNRTPNLTGIRYKAETWQFFSLSYCIKMVKRARRHCNWGC